MSLKKIAEMTGISVSTVGRILSNPEHKCSNSQTRDKVLEAAREIGYVPNLAARDLRKGKKKNDKLFLADIILTRYGSESADPFYDELLRLCEKELRTAECIVGGVYYLSDLSDEKFDSDTEKLIDNFFRTKAEKSDGIVIIGKCTERALKQIKKYSRNNVMISRNSANYAVDEVICDGKRLAASAVEYLLGLGHTKIGFVGNCHHEARFKGFQQAISKADLSPDINHIFNAVPNEQNGISAMEHFMDLADPPTGIYCANDILAVGMLQYLRRIKSRRYEPSIIGCDDIEQAQFTSPMLTTISLPKADMARFAVMLLMDRIKGGHKTVSRIELPGTLIIRESCHPAGSMFEPEYYI